MQAVKCVSSVEDPMVDVPVDRYLEMDCMWL
jgi:hypothetical protein